MKTIFLWMLRKYANTEKGRIEIMRIMDDKVSDNYSEQTLYGNVYNYFIVKCTLKDDKESLSMLKSGIEKSFDEAIGYIENEK